VHADSPTAAVVTLSIGVATAPPSRQASAAIEIVSRADKALYDAKGKGRNGIVQVTL
jgi:PleD family two-component response regulator